MNTRTCYDLGEGWSLLECRHGNRWGFALLSPNREYHSFRPDIVLPLIDALAIILDKNKEVMR